MPSKPQNPVGDILIVDDTLANLHLLVEILKDRGGYKVRPVTSGPTALRAAKSAIPDLVLLDINMPEMNGFEVCEAFKKDHDLRHVPIIFISANSGTDDKVKAFSNGGVDYITKPFQIAEVQARVATHIRIERLQIKLEEQNLELQRRNRELERLRAMQANLSNMIVHDLRAPLAGIMGYLELLQINTTDSLPLEHRSDIDKALRACRSATDMVSSLLDITRLESAQMPLSIGDCDLSQVAGEALQGLAGSNRCRNIEIEQPNGPVHALSDATVTQRIITNLVQNAIQVTRGNGCIRVGISVRAGKAQIEVHDDGPGIRPEFLPRVFEKFGQVDIRQRDRSQSFGIGLAFCKLAVEAQCGEIGVDSRVGEGSRFWFTLPLAQSLELNPA